MHGKQGSAWTQEELLDFLALTHQERLAAVEDIAEWLTAFWVNKDTGFTESFDTWRSRRQAEHRLVVLAHSVCKELSASDHFRAAFETFKRGLRRRNARGRHNRRDDEFAAEMRFLNIVASYVGAMILAQQRQTSPKKVARRTAAQALGHLKKLSELMGAGIRLPSWKYQTTLTEGIAALKDHLEQQIASPKQYRLTSGASWIQSLSRKLKSELGTASPTVIKELANMVEYSADDRTIERNVARGAKG